MLPVKSNTADLGCTPVSSNCVVWQGPNIPCINLCTGDTVSSVVYKVAHDLCTIKSSLDLTNLDLSCLVEFCTSVGPAPTTKTLAAVLDFIVKKVCCLNDLIEGGAGTPEPPAPEALLALPTCLQTSGDAATGYQISHRNFTLRLGDRFCTLKAAVDLMADHKTRIEALESRPAITLPTVTPQCILPSQSTAMNVVLAELEKQYCLLRTALGTNSQITLATAQQCTGLSNANALSQPGLMSGLAGWISNPANMAQAFQNLWITVCDLRGAIASLKDCCGKTDCSQFVLSCQVSTNNDRTVVTFDFNPGTVIPAGFINALSGSTITIKAGTNTRTISSFDLVQYASSTGVFSVTVAGSGVPNGEVVLNTSQEYVVTIIGRIIKDQTSCEKTFTETLRLACPIISSVTATLVP